MTIDERVPTVPRTPHLLHPRQSKTMEYNCSIQFQFVSVLGLALLMWLAFFLADVAVLLLVNLKRALTEELSELLTGEVSEDDELEGFDDSNYPMG